MPSATRPPSIFRAVLLGAGLLFPAIGVVKAAAEDARAAWEKQVGERQRDNPAFDFVEDDPALPRVLLIGDSISIGYTAYVREALAGRANVHRIPTNGGDTNRGVAQIDAWLGSEPWDVIHFNWGLHDIKRIKDGALDATADRSVTPEAYEANLRALATRLQKTGASLIWCSTTPVPDGAKGRIPGDEVHYNTIARTIMEAMQISVHDLYSRVKPELAVYQRSADVHFHPEGSAFLGKEVARALESALAARAPANPTPGP